MYIKILFFFCFPLFLFLFFLASRNPSNYCVAIYCTAHSHRRSAFSMRNIRCVVPAVFRLCILSRCKPTSPSPGTTRLFFFFSLLLLDILRSLLSSANCAQCYTLPSLVDDKHRHDYNFVLWGRRDVTSPALQQPTNLQVRLAVFGCICVQVMEKISNLGKNLKKS